MLLLLQIFFLILIGYFCNFYEVNELFNPSSRYPDALIHVENYYIEQIVCR